MLKGPRLSVRFAMFGVAVVAIALTSWNEVHSRRLRDAYTQAEDVNLQQAEDHERLAAFCLKQRASVYDAQARHVATGGSMLSETGSPLNFTSWDEEARFHGRIAASHRMQAEQFERRVQETRKHLLFP